MMKKLLTVILACMLAVACVGCSAGKASKTYNSPEKVAAQYVKAVLYGDIDTMDKCTVVTERQIIQHTAEELSVTEAELYENFPAEIGEIKTGKVSTYDEYKKACRKFFKEGMKEDFGEKYSVKTSVVSVTDAAVEDIKDTYVFSFYSTTGLGGYSLSQLIDLSEIQEVKRVNLKLRIEGGEGGDEEQEMAEAGIYVVKINGKWKVSGFFSFE